MTENLSEDEAALGHYLDRRNSGDPLAPEEFLAAHPTVRVELERHMSTLHALDRLIDEARAARPVPQRLNDYQLLRCLGRGGMGTVYLAEHTHEERLVALKVIERSLTHSQSTVQRFANEARLGRRLRHPNLVTVYEEGTDEHYAYFAMEFVPGISLAKAITKVRELRKKGERHIDLTGLVQADVHKIHEEFGLEEPSTAGDEQVRGAEGYFAAVARIVAEVADALDHLHHQNVVHRDVKPENILLDGRVTPYLGDFGLAKDEAGPGLTNTGAMLGTVPYMSPEMASGGAKAVDRRTDIYSLGVTLYELLTLRTPHEARSTHGILRKIGVEIPARPRSLDPSIPRELETIALKAIESRQARRYQSAEEMAEDLRRYLRLDPIIAKPPGPGRVIARFLQRHRVPSLVSGVLALALGAWWIAGHRAKAREWNELLTEVRQLHAEDRLAEMGPIVARLLAIDTTTEVEGYARMSRGTVPVPFSSTPGRADVWAQRLDGPAGSREESVLLGATKVDGPSLQAWLDSGVYRVVVQKRGFGSGEYLLHVPSKRAQPGIQATLRADPEVLVGMLEVPAGDYRLGFNPPNARGTAFDLEDRTVQIQAFYIDKHEVSNTQYRRFVEATRARPPWRNGVFPEAEAEHPVTFVTWAEANAYAEWAGKRLPTELEWEAAARGKDGRLYTWGNEFLPELANLGPATGVVGEGESGTRRTLRPLSTVPVTTANGDVSPFGVRHMAGNVKEWVFDRWIPRAGVQPHETWQLGNNQHVVRGSSCLPVRSPSMTRASFRTPVGQNDQAKDLGFRCAKSKLP